VVSEHRKGASLLLREFFLDLAFSVNKPADLSRSIEE
jgi:hypothetical protein